MRVPVVHPPVREALTDVTVIAIFTPLDPPGATSVEIDGQDTMDPDTYLALIDEAARRLATYARSYRTAMQEDLRRRL